MRVMIISTLFSFPFAILPPALLTAEKAAHERPVLKIVSFNHNLLNFRESVLSSGVCHLIPYPNLYHNEWRIASFLFFSVGKKGILIILLLIE
jgi:hypothetical protein